MKIQKVLLLFFILAGFKITIAQNFSSQNSGQTSIYTAFDTFFEDEIRKQGVKGNWIFKLNEVYGLHKFDFNKDGFHDTFMEFSAVQEESEGITLYFGVLFKNYNDEDYILINYLETPEIRLSHFEENLFYFNSTQNESVSIVYELVNSKFIKK